MKKIGIYSGTFDPVHNGHVALALSSIKHAGLNKVYFLPERKPWDKHNVLGYDKRLNMLQIALKDHSGCGVLDISKERFTIHRTLPELKCMFPDHELYFIFGADIFIKMTEHIWEGISELLSNSTLLVGYRNPHEVNEIERAAKQLEKQTYSKVRYELIMDTLPELSSSDIRQRAAQGKDISKFVPECVATLILEQHFYAP